MTKCRVDVIASIVLLESQNESGMKAAGPSMFLLEPFEEVLCRFSQSEKGFSDRLQSEAYFGVGAMLRVFHHF